MSGIPGLFFCQEIILTNVKFVEYVINCNHINSTWQASHRFHELMFVPIMFWDHWKLNKDFIYDPRNGDIFMAIH